MKKISSQIKQTEKMIQGAIKLKKLYASAFSHYKLNQHIFDLESHLKRLKEQREKIIMDRQRKEKLRSSLRENNGKITFDPGKKHGEVVIITKIDMESGEVSVKRV